MKRNENEGEREWRKAECETCVQFSETIQLRNVHDDHNIQKIKLCVEI